MPPFQDRLAPVASLFLCPATSEIHTFLVEFQLLVARAPELVHLVEADLDEHALKKKAIRVADADWSRSLTLVLTDFVETAKPCEKVRTRLGQGRPRTSGHIVLLMVLLRGRLGSGFKAETTDTLLRESVTFQVYLNNIGVRMPRASTLTELVNAVSDETRSRIHDAQIAQTKTDGLDDFTAIIQDSTAVESNTVWPTDSGVTVALMARLDRGIEQLANYGLPTSHSKHSNKRRRALAKSRRLARDIDLASGKNAVLTRKRKYMTLLAYGASTLAEIRRAQVAIQAGRSQLVRCPSELISIDKVLAQFESDATKLAQVLVNCEGRIRHNRKISATERIVSISDPDAALIVKGQRDTIVGYKSQLARSRNGFIVGLGLPAGNAADSRQFLPMIDEVMARTGVIPSLVSVDDGYASKANVAGARARGIDVISISGSKGRALTSDADWVSDSYAMARNQRSAVESSIFTLKEGFNFGLPARRGHARVYAELLEKVLAHNLCVAARRRAELRARAVESPVPLAA